MIKIWLRINHLTHGRNVFGIPIHYDGVVRCLRDHPDVDLYADFDIGNDVRNPMPIDKDERMKIIFGYFDGWDDEEFRDSVLYVALPDEPIPQGWIDKINLSRALIIASTESQKCLSQYVNVPVFVWIPGVDDYFHYVDRDFYSNPFTFLNVSVIQGRKGCDLACQGFVRAFPDNPNVRFILRSPAPTEMSDFLMKLYTLTEPRIIFDFKVIPHDQMQSAYEDGHCFVYPSLAEGVGLTLPEAMRTGMPSIVSRTSGMLDTFNNDSGWWIDVEEKNQYSVRLPKIDSTVECMRYAYTHRDECREKGLNASRYIENNLTWGKSIEKIYPILKELYEESYNSNG
jgi:glycosyltransferase involved in cell wall biosynthesis